MRREKYEQTLAMQTEAGREANAVWLDVQRKLTGEQKLQKVFEMTEMTRQIMRAGIRDANPNATEQEIQEMYVDRLLGYNGTSLAEVRRQQRDQAQAS